MNILILNWRDIKHEWAGGSEVYIFELAKRWVKMGHSVTLFCGQDVNKKLPEEEVINGIDVIRKGGMFSLYFWAFWNYITRFNKDTDIIIDVQNGIPFFSTLYSRKPVVSIAYHVHGKQFFVELPFPLSLVGFVAERYFFPLFYSKSKIMAISETTRKGLIANGFKRKNIEIVYCGINGKKVNLTSKKFSHPTILYLGRIKKYKRVDMLVKIMPEISKRIPNANLLIAGWGTEAASLTDMSMRSSSRRKIKIIGPVSEAEKKYLLTKSWVFVNPSIGEGWGIAIIEANLHGTPAVAFNVAGLSESIKNGETGILVETENEMIEAILKILKDEKTRTALRRNSLKWAETFNWDAASEQSIKLLEKARTNK